MTQNRFPRLSWLVILVVVPGFTLAADKGPNLGSIKEATNRYFARVPNYQPGDLIDRGQAAGLLKDLRSRGWKLVEANALVGKVPDAGEFLAQALRTPTGMKFMRQVSKMPLGFDRLDRLAQLPHGQQTIRDLIRGPDGYKMIAYMTGASGGKQLGRMLSTAPNAAGFNLATGRIYTAETLAEKLSGGK
jgi:hypothetical protein